MGTNAGHCWTGHKELNRWSLSDHCYAAHNDEEPGPAQCHKPCLMADSIYLEVTHISQTCSPLKVQSSQLLDTFGYFIEL